MRLTAIFFLTWLLLPGITFQLAAQEEQKTPQPIPQISFFRSFTIEQSQEGGTANDIYTVKNQPNSATGLFRPPPDSKKDPALLPQADLAYVIPGGLEPISGEGYSFPWDQQVGDKYSIGSYSFSGRADGLVFRPTIGWGNENQNGDFIPGLIMNTYEQKDVPSVSIFWEYTRPKRPDQDIYLNYPINVPKNSQVQWGNENFMTRYTLAGVFSARAPEVQSLAVYRWHRGTLQVFEQDLKTLPDDTQRSFPDDMPAIKGFALSKDAAIFFAATSDTKIMALKDTGESVWSAEGRAPIITFKDFLIAIAPGYQAINILDAQNGKILNTCELPKFLPRDDNSFTLVSGQKQSWLFLNVPAQSRVLCFKLSLPSPDAQKESTVEVKKATPAPEKKAEPTKTPSKKPTPPKNNPLLYDDDEYTD